MSKITIYSNQKWLSYQIIINFYISQQTSVYVYGRGLMQFLDWALFESEMLLDLKEVRLSEINHSKEN